MAELAAVQQALLDVTVAGVNVPLAAFVSAVEDNGELIEMAVSIPLDQQPGLVEQASSRLNKPVQFRLEVPSAAVQASLDALSGVKNTIVVASGKGGVGKSTTSVNLALALQAQGARVGLMDADIYGPSIQLMLGVEDGVRPQQQDGKFFIPVPAQGLQTMSMAYLVTDKTPMVWRGPMASGALQQMLKQTLWDDLDYLIIDMPPGTGDIQLTLSQQLPVTGAVIVTTPQNVALLDAQKGIEMFNKVSVPIIGVVENMSYHECSSCGHRDAIFGEGAGAGLAAGYEVELLGNLPLNTAIREHADSGKTLIGSEQYGTISAEYSAIALKVAAWVANSAASAPVAPTIEISDE